MKKIIIKPIVLLLVFIGALITFSFTTNWVNQDLTAKMADATFPVIYFYKDQIKINELHGYVQEMDAVEETIYFFSSKVSQNESNIADHETRITTLENNLSGGDNSSSEIVN